MITSKKKLKEYLEADAQNYKSQKTAIFKVLKTNILSNPINDQKIIWLYIKSLRYVEYYGQKRNKNILYLLKYLYYSNRLRKYS